MKLQLDVTSCLGCICRRSHYGQGESWNYCGHPDAPTGYKNILNDVTQDAAKIPKWCPIAGGSNGK